MKVSQDQYRLVEHVFPIQRGNVSVTNLDVLNAFLYLTEQGCNWRDIPAQFGHWHTIYTRLSRWSKSGVLIQAISELQRKRVIKISIEGASQVEPTTWKKPVGTMNSTGSEVGESMGESVDRAATVLWVPLILDLNRQAPSLRRSLHARVVKKMQGAC